MGGRCTTLVDGTSPCQLAYCCSSSSSSSATVSVNTHPTPASRSTQKSRASVSEESRSASKLRGEDAITSAPHLGDYGVAPKRRGSRSSDQGDPAKKKNSRVSEATSSIPENKTGDKGSDESKLPVGEESLALQSSIPVGVVKELKTFRQFLKPRHSTLDEAYDSLLGYAMVLDEKRFMVRMEELEYMGNSERLFNALATDGTITRDAIKEQLVAVAKLPEPRRKSISFGVVALHDYNSLGEDVAQLPPIEIPVEEAEEAKESRPKATYKEELIDYLEIRRAQPGASGQPASGSETT